jgi:hypothetical protein
LAPETARALGTIRGADIVTHARVLSDPKYRGREAGTPAVRKAAEYIAAHFRKAGLLPGGEAGSFFQPFKIRLGYQIASRMEVSIGPNVMGEFQRNEDYIPIHLPGGRADLAGECVLAGYGISAPELKFDEYAGVDGRGKLVVVFSGVPWPPRAAAWIGRATAGQKFESIGYKARNAAAHGAVCLLVVDDPAGWRRDIALAERLRIPDFAGALDVSIPVMHVTRRFVTELTGLSADEMRLLAQDIRRERLPEVMPLRGRRVRLEASVSGTAWVGRNVVGVLPGRDEALRREAVVLGAHYDHLGEIGERVYFGANDNAAGVGALLTIAHAMGTQSPRPRRSVVFVAFDAEEVGRRGSKHYVARPPIPIAQTTLMVNFDMIGRNAPDSIFAVGTRSSPDLHRLHQEANQHVGLRLEHPQSFRLGRSDHSPFYYAGVPILYLFGGLDPDYNTPRDTWDRLIKGKAEKVARLAFLTALRVAEQPKRLSYERHEEGEVPPMGRWVE